MSLNLKSLIGKLDDATRSALEAAAGLCVSRTHYDIEIEHYLLKAIDSSDNDIAFILKQYGVDQLAPHHGTAAQPRPVEDR